jgi:hypothetical protein
LPAGVPPGFEDDVGAEDVPAAALIPLQTDVAGSWIVGTPAEEAILVSWNVPGPDPFLEDRGVVLWRRFDDGGEPWRPVWGKTFPAKRDPVLGIDASVADVTADGSEDAIVFAESGGSGGCGTYLVVDAVAGRSVFEEQGCDRAIEPSADPIGLLRRQAVYEEGDAHCCPSAWRIDVLTYVDGEWATASSTTSPA